MRKVTRKRGRPAGYLDPNHCPVTDAAAFLAALRMLRDHATEQPRGAVMQLAYLLGVSHTLVGRYLKHAPLTVSPQFAASLRNAASNVQRFPFDRAAYDALLDRAIDFELAEGINGALQSFGWRSDNSVSLESVLGATVHTMRASGKLSAGARDALPREVWIHCSPRDAEILKAVFADVRILRVRKHADGADVWIV